MKDIETREDIEKLLESFYSQALTDEVIGYIFTDVAKLDLSHHLPIISDFWEMMLFQTLNFQEKYKRSPMAVHLQLNEKTLLKKEHFIRWLTLFTETVNKNFIGEKADLAIFRAKAIANTIYLKVSQESPEGVQVVRE
jgi:hemoglobin